MNRETRTRWYNHKCSKCLAHPFVIIIRIVLYALVRYLRPTLYWNKTCEVGTAASYKSKTFLQNLMLILLRNS